MGNILRTALLGAFALTVMATSAEACSRKTVNGGNTQINPARIDQAKLDKAIQLELNYQRCRLGLKSLKTEPRLRKAAERHARWMAKARNLSHTSNQPGQRSIKARITKAGVKARMGSENIMKLALYKTEGPAGYKVVNASQCRFTTIAGKPIERHTYSSMAQYAVKLFMNSPSHRRNMTDRKIRLTATAAGYDAKARNCGAIYLSQKFVG